MSLLKELREKIKLCPDVLVREAMKLAADDLHDAIEDFYQKRNMGTMTRLNGAWARALRVKCQTPRPSSPNSGAVRLDETQKAA